MSVENEKRLINRRKWQVRSELHTHPCKTCRRPIKERKSNNRKKPRRSTSLPTKLDTYRYRGPQIRAIPTHFLAFEIGDDDVRSKVKEVRDEIERNVDDVTRLEDAKMPHITLQVMKIKSEKVAEVEATLKRCCKETFGGNFCESDAEARVRDIGTFQQGHVVMAEAELPPVVHKLRRRIVSALIGRFADGSIGKLDEGAVKLHHDFNPHVTIAKGKRERPMLKIAKSAYAKKYSNPVRFGSERFTSLKLFNMNYEKCAEINLLSLNKNETRPNDGVHQTEEEGAFEIGWLEKYCIVNDNTTN